MLKAIARIGGLAAVIGCLASSAAAQSSTSIRGTIFDQAMAVLPGVVVTATNEATGITREVVTGSEGRFTMSALNPGTYALGVELPGFQSQMRQGVVLQVGQEVTINFTLPVASVAETVTVTGESPLIDTTTSQLGEVVTAREIDTIPSQGRTQFGLVQLVPGVTPNLNSIGEGDFEGDNFSSNGQVGDRNQWNVDGVSNQQSNGGGSGPQARIPLDSTAEFQVLTHQYTADSGGSSGVIINAVTKSGTNQFTGAGFYFNTSEKLAARNYFLPDDEEKPVTSQHISGFAFGGPIVRNRAFFFFNLDSIRQKAVHIHTFPEEAKPTFKDYNATEAVRRFATLTRLDLSAGAHNFRFTWSREPKPSVAQGFDCCATLDHRPIEMSYGDRGYNGGWTVILGNRATNELIVSRIGENRIVTNMAVAGIAESDYFTDGWLDNGYTGLAGRDQFDLGSASFYADFATGLRDDHNGRVTVLPAVRNAFTYAGNSHTFKVGGTWDYRNGTPEYRGNGDNGIFTFQHNLPFNPADARTYPSQFQILLGNIRFDQTDTFWNAFGQDRWRVNDNLTLDLGLRWDYQEQTPSHKDAFAPRLGFAYDPTGTGRTVIRGGAGKFYDYHFLGTAILLRRNGVFSQTFEFDTGEDLAADEGVIPTSHVCLQPSLDGRLAAISPACRAFLTNLRDSLQPGAGAEFINTEPLLDTPDRVMGYLWGYSVGVEHQLITDLAAGIHYVGNRGRDQMGRVDINEGPPDANGRVTRLGVDAFDPDGTLIPGAARSARFQRVLQYTISDAFNTAFDSLETTLVKRFSAGWSARASYTLSYAKDVGFANPRVAYDLNPREDYGRSNQDNRHTFAAGVNVSPWRPVTIGAMFRAYSGYPINETVGRDVNGDRDNTDRPVRGVDDLTRPILSPLDSDGRAVRNGINGNGLRLLDLTFRYNLNLPGARVQTVGFYLDLYNALNTTIFGNPTGNRNSRNFMVPVVAGRAREAQIGIRYTF